MTNGFLKVVLLAGGVTWGGLLAQSVPTQQGQSVCESMGLYDPFVLSQDTADDLRYTVAQTQKHLFLIAGVNTDYCQAVERVAELVQKEADAKNNENLFPNQVNTLVGGYAQEEVSIRANILSEIARVRDQLLRNLTPTQQSRLKVIESSIDAAQKIITLNDDAVSGNLIPGHYFSTTDLEYATGMQPYPTLGPNMQVLTVSEVNHLFAQHVSKVVAYQVAQRANAARRARTLRLP